MLFLFINLVASSKFYWEKSCKSGLENPGTHSFYLTTCLTLSVEWGNEQFADLLLKDPRVNPSIDHAYIALKRRFYSLASKIIMDSRVYQVNTLGLLHLITVHPKVIMSSNMSPYFDYLPRELERKEMMNPLFEYLMQSGDIETYYSELMKNDMMMTNFVYWYSKEVCLEREYDATDLESIQRCDHFRKDFTDYFRYNHYTKSIGELQEMIQMKIHENYIPPHGKWYLASKHHFENLNKKLKKCDWLQVKNPRHHRDWLNLLHPKINNESFMVNLCDVRNTNAFVE